MWADIDPTAHAIELPIRAAVPIGLRSPVLIDGATSSISPPNPADNPIIVDFVSLCPNPTFFLFLYNK